MFIKCLTESRKTCHNRTNWVDIKFKGGTMTHPLQQEWKQLVLLYHNSFALPWITITVEQNYCVVDKYLTCIIPQWNLSPYAAIINFLVQMARSVMEAFPEPPHIGFQTTVIEMAQARRKLALELLQASGACITSPSWPTVLLLIINVTLAFQFSTWLTTVLCAPQPYVLDLLTLTG